MKLLASFSYGYQIMNINQHSATKYLNAKKTHAAINCKLFKKLDRLNNSIYEWSSPKYKLNTNNQSLSAVSSFNTQSYECWNCTTTFTTNSVNWTSSKSWKWTLILCILLLPKKNWKNAYDLKWKQNGNICAEKTALIVSMLIQLNFFPRMCCGKHKKHDKRKPGLFKEEFRCSEMLCLRSETYCYYEETSNKLKFRSKALKKWKLEQSGVATLENYRKVLQNEVNNTALKCDFRSTDHTVATYERSKRSLVYFGPKRNKDLGMHTQRQNLWLYSCLNYSLYGVCCFIQFFLKLFRDIIFFLLAHNQIMHEDAHFSCLQVF